jgi:hypothetical protein
MSTRELIDFFVKDVRDSSSEDDLDASSGLMVAVASIIHEHIEIQAHLAPR